MRQPAAIHTANPKTQKLGYRLKTLLHMVIPNWYSLVDRACLAHTIAKLVLRKRLAQLAHQDFICPTQNALYADICALIAWLSIVYLNAVSAQGQHTWILQAPLAKIVQPEQPLVQAPMSYQHVIVDTI